MFSNHLLLQPSFYPTYVLIPIAPVAPPTASQSKTEHLKMYSSMRVFFYALNLLAWSLLVFVGTTPAVAPALAAPLALPMYRSADFAPRVPSNASISAPPTSSTARRQLDLAMLGGLTKLGSATRRDTSNILSQIAILNNYYNGMQSNVEAFSECLVDVCRTMS